MSEAQRISLLLVVIGAATACQPIQEPWVSGGQYAEERTRTPEVADELRRRIKTVQQDR